MSPKSSFVCLLGLLCVWETGAAQDFLRLKNGQIARGAIVRLDSATVFLADWEERHLPLPRLQVFTKNEIESIWFHRPPQVEQRTLYRPHERGWEIGGGITFQSMREDSVTPRHLPFQSMGKAGEISRQMLQLSLLGGYTVFPAAGIEIEADFTFPHGERADTTWHRYRSGYQIAFNVLVHPVQVRGLTPFALIGGGAATAIPVNGTIFTESRGNRNLLNLGAGFKFGQRGIGCRLEYRYQRYAWTPDEITPIYDSEGNSVGELRVEAQEAFCHLVRFGLFFYR